MCSSSQIPFFSPRTHTILYTSFAWMEIEEWQQSSFTNAYILEYSYEWSNSFNLLQWPAKCSILIKLWQHIRLDLFGAAVQFIYMGKLKHLSSSALALSKRAIKHNESIIEDFTRAFDAPQTIAYQLMASWPVLRNFLHCREQWVSECRLKSIVAIAHTFLLIWSKTYSRHMECCGIFIWSIIIIIRE